MYRSAWPVLKIAKLAISRQHHRQSSALSANTPTLYSPVDNAFPVGPLLRPALAKCALRPANAPNATPISQKIAMECVSQMTTPRVKAAGGT